MSSSVKEKISADLKQAKDTGKLRGDRIREILYSAVSEIKSELKEGSGELRSLVKDVFSTAISAIQATGNEAKEEVTATVDGVIDGISRKRQEKIAETEASIKQLQAKLEKEEADLEQDLENSIVAMKEAGENAPDKVREQIEAAIASLQNSEEANLLRKRYAQLQAQAALLRANLAARTGNYYDRAKEHLDDARNWYDRVQPKAEEIKGQTDQTVSQLQQKISEAGAALSRREDRVRQMLSDLLRQASEAVKDNGKKTSSNPKLPPADEDLS
jgi:hypothetical protein